MELRRNDPCPCGSGVKYKKCCAAAATGAAHDPLGEAAELVGRGDIPAAAALFAGAEEASRDAVAVYYRLGVALQDRGLETAGAACYRQTLALRPDYVAALNNLGVLLKNQRDFAGAEGFLQKALALRPEVAMGHYNLGVVLVELNRGTEARLCFAKTLELQPDYVEAHYNLGLLARECGELATASTYFRRAVELRPDYPRARVELAILTWLNGDFASCAAELERISTSKRRPTVDEYKSIEPFSYFLEKLLDYRRAYGDLYLGDADMPGLYAVGDSHCLALAHLPVVLRGADYRVDSRIVVGAKAWNLGRKQPNRYQLGLEKIVATIPSGAPVLALFGEIDCRLDAGIILHHRKTANNLGQAIPELVADYLTYLAQLCGTRALKLVVANVPAPLIKNAAVSEDEWRLQIQVVQEFNRALGVGCTERNLPLLDIYGASVGPDGLAHGQYHLDAVHLQPGLYQKLLGKL